jgi:hypothetical protein
MKRLRDEFENVRKTFFPRWDRDGLWSVVVKPDLPGTGFCRPLTKTIQLVQVPRDENELHRLLIHEICHAVVPASGLHGKRWRRRYLKAAERARALGRSTLAKAIEKDVAAYSDPSRGITVGAPYVYRCIEDFMMDNPNASYDAAIEAVARWCCMYPRELEQRYKRCKVTYGEAKLPWALERRGRAARR